MVSASPIWPLASARSPRSIATCRSSSCRCRALSRCRGARPTSPLPSTDRRRDGWSRQSWSTTRSASMRRAPMPRGTACRKARPNCPAICWSATWRIWSPARRSTTRPNSARSGTRVSRSRRRSGRSRRCAPAPASASCTPSLHDRSPTSCRSWRCRRSAAPTGWSTMKSVRPMRRVQTVAAFIQRAVEKERALFA